MESVKRILVVSRMTMFSRKAIRYGISLASKYGAELFVAHVVDESNLFDEWFPVSIKKSAEELRKNAKKEIDRIINSERESGVYIKELFPEGDSYKEIMKIVKEKNIDFLILPTHEEGRIEHYLFSHINDKIIREMPCSVLLVKCEPEFIKIGSGDYK